MTTLTLQGVGAASQRPDVGCPNDCDPPIQSDAVYVLFTTIDATLAAARVGHHFATAMAVPLTLVHLRSVPYPLPVDRPAGVSPLETQAFLDRLDAAGVQAQIRIVLCRDAYRTISTAVPRHSLVVVGGRRRWWPSRIDRWRRVLDSAGHYVVFVDQENSHA